MNRIASRLRATEVERRVGNMRSDTPYIRWDASRNAWLVCIKDVARRFFNPNKYDGSASAALIAATEYRDSLLPADIREAMYRKLDANAGRVDIPDTETNGPRFRPTLVSQWQLWHKPRTNKQQP